MENRIASLRKACGLSQQALGKACGLDQQWVSRLETGGIRIENIRLENAARLAEALGVSVEELMLPPTPGE